MKILKVLFLFICVSSFAQSKVGTVDVDYILSKMPELADVQKEVDAYGAKLDVDLNKKVEAYKKEIAAWQEGEAKFTAVQKKEKQESIVALEEDLNKYQQNGDKLMMVKRNAALAPLYEKIGGVLDKIAKAQGYTQVMQITKDLVFIDEKYDLTVPVLNEMGIKIETASQNSGSEK